jgi:predicted NUDIX family phosphoesterase
MRKILVIETNRLFRLTGGNFQGFRVLPSKILDDLEKYSHWMEKDAAEIDPYFKQIIGYSAILSPSGRIFTYQRSTKDKHYKEKRLQGKWSVGIGGHVEHSLTEEKISASIIREINEEVETYGGIREITLLGGINDDSNAVGMVHFGLLLLARTFCEKAAPKDKEISFGEFKTPAEISLIFEAGDAENWSQICLPHISHM